MSKRLFQRFKKNFTIKEPERKNVIILNVIELNSEIAVDNKNHDLSELKKIATMCNIKIKNYDNNKISRIGKKKSDAPQRPIHIIFFDIGKKSSFMKNLKYLKGKNVDIRVSNDLTAEQREARKNLIKEAQEKTENDQTGLWNFIMKKWLPT